MSVMYGLDENHFSGSVRTKLYESGLSREQEAEMKNKTKQKTTKQWVKNLLLKFCYEEEPRIKVVIVEIVFFKDDFFLKPLQF